MKIVYSFLVLAVVLVACQARSDLPVVTSSPIGTDLISTGSVQVAPGTMTAVNIPLLLATTTPSTPKYYPPTITPPLTQTPGILPTLSAISPYLIYSDTWLEKTTTAVIDLHGGCRVIQMPANAQLVRLESGVSPNGRWLAFFTGSISGPEYDLALQLYSIPDGQIVTVASLIENYPAGLQKLADQLAPRYPELSPLARFELLQEHFIRGLGSLAWAPNSEHLAFSGQIDSLSTDVYLYDISSGKISRVTNDDDLLFSLAWTPNGEYLLVENSLIRQNPQATTLTAIHSGIEGTFNQKPIRKGPLGQGIGWLSPKYYLVVANPAGGLWADLRAIDVDSGEVFELWPGQIVSYAVAEDLQAIAVSGYLESAGRQTGAELGTYLVKLDGTQEQIAGPNLRVLEYRGGNNSGFLASDGNGYTFLLPDGTTQDFEGWGLSWHSVSPDRRWLVLYDESHLEVYDSTNRRIKTLSIQFTNEILWRPDSTGFVFTSGSASYYYAISDDHQFTLHDCQSGSLWLPGASRAWIP